MYAFNGFSKWRTCALIWRAFKTMMAARSRPKASDDDELGNISKHHSTVNHVIWGTPNNIIIYMVFPCAIISYHHIVHIYIFLENKHCLLQRPNFPFNFVCRVVAALAICSWLSSFQLLFHKHPNPSRCKLPSAIAKRPTLGTTLPRA